MSDTSLKLLVIDDDDVDRERIRRMLKASDVNAEIEEAVSADESIAILTDDDYDCVIVDYRLGSSDGLTLLNDIRTTLAKRCAIIMVTGLGDEEVAAEAMRLGASDYLVKNQLKSPRLLRAILSAVHRADLEKKLHSMAHYDALTGLVSRHLLLDRLQQVIGQSARSDKLAALAFIDLDDFKPVNDTFGHAAGDQVLIEVANRLTTTLRTSDTVARIGGDEFVLLLTDVGSADACELLLHRILLILGVPVILPDGAHTRISASIGVTMVVDAHLDADTVLRRADQTMYQAKNAGRNRIHFFDAEAEQRQQKKRDIFETFELGITRREFVLHYQPKINMSTREVVGFEALIRWNHPGRGFLLPGSFVEALEHVTLGISIGEWVLREALRQLSLWSAQGLSLSVSVNISAPHLQHIGFVQRLGALLAEVPHVAPAQLELEILETASIKDMDSVVNILDGCRELGVNIALDDFGTGYASLHYLKKLPLDVLKIDQSFIKNMLSSNDDRAIVESIIGLSRTFGYQLIAEGVETRAHEKALIDMGCNLGQGYSIARPMDADFVPKWLLAHKK